MKKRAATTARSTVRIEALGAFGDGLAADAGGPIAVPFTAPGDLVDIETSRRGRHQSARLRRVVEAGPDRVEPGCRHFERCGGCRLQHISDHAYATWKDGLWRTALVRAGIPEEALAQAHIHPLRRVAPKSRRRARLAVHRGRVGFRQEKSHRIEPIESCLVLHPELLSVARALASTFDKVRLSASEISLSLLDDGVEAVIHADGALDYSALQDLADLAESLDLARLSQAEKAGTITPIAHRRTGLMASGGVAVDVPPIPFLQATAESQQMLQGFVAKWIGSAERIADLYSGCGAFALPLVTERSSRRVLAVDKNGPAIMALDQAAATHGLVGRLACRAQDLARDPLLPRELEGFDAVVFDPPRAGAKDQVEQLAKSAVPDIVAISCNPVTFARDAALLLASGYRLVELAPLDQFLWTAHLELAAHFRKG